MIGSLAAMASRADLHLAESKIVTIVESSTQITTTQTNTRRHELLQNQASLRASLQSVARRSDLDECQTAIADRLDHISQCLPAASLELSRPRASSVLTFPRLSVDGEGTMFILKEPLLELKAVLQVLGGGFGTIAGFLVFAIPQLVLLGEVLRRLPPAVSLVLRDNIRFEDACGRVHGLQYAQFRYWAVFERFLQSTFDDTNACYNLKKGFFILRANNRKATILSSANYASLVRPGYSFLMSAIIPRDFRHGSCPRGCR